MNQIELIDKALTETKGTSTDLAKRLGFTKSIISDWKSGRRPIPPEAILSLAILAKVDPVLALAECMAARAEGPTKEAWTELARRAAFFATLSALCLWPMVHQATVYGRARMNQLPIMYIRLIRLLKKFINDRKKNTPCFFSALRRNPPAPPC